MARTAAHDSHPIPYAQASPAQLAQAIIGAREALGPCYPHITWPQWHQAFGLLAPSLKSEAGQFTITSQSLSELARRLEAMHSSPSPVSASPDLPAQVVEALALPLRAAHQEAKKTYSIYLELLEQLSRVSFWRRERKSALVNLALAQLLAQYPESQIPIPETFS